MIRVCPHSDSKCAHGMSCQFSCATDKYNDTKMNLFDELAGLSPKKAAELDHPLDGKMEPASRDYDAFVSIAISLKRIADTLDGTASGICVSETLVGGMPQWLR